MNSLGINIILRMGCLCSRESLRIKSKKYLIKDIIGEGGFSRVYLVEDSVNHRMFAIKKIICHSLEDEMVAMSEVKIHSLVQHENVISLVDYEMSGVPDPISNTTSQVCLVLPYYKRGTLHDELERRSALKHPFTTPQVLELFLKVCEGLKAFHELTPPLAHRDLKTANILLDELGDPVIMDLGSATEARVQVCGSPDAQKLQDLAAERCSMPYKAPELFNVENYGIVDERTDVWSLGCILFALCFYKSPFDAVYERGDSVALAVLSGNLQFPAEHNFGEEMEEFIKSILKVDPMERLFIYSVIEKGQDLLSKVQAKA